MNYLKQDDYDSFRCIADKCPKSCCCGWQIVIDDESLDNYENNESDFQEQLLEGIDWYEGAFKQYGGRCSMLNDAGLCKMQLALGEDALCYTCGMYPRHVEEFEGIRELSLSLSCPEVARMVVERENQYSFIESEDEEDDDFEDFDYLLYTKLVDAREVIYNILFDRETNIFVRLRSILDFAIRLQNYIENDNLYEMDDEIDAYPDIYQKSKKDENISFDEKICSPKVLNKLERLDNEWSEVLIRLKTEISDRKSSEFVEEIISMVTKKEEIVLENIAVLLIYTYFCGAVYDDEIYTKAALCIYSVLWIYIIYKSECKTENHDRLIQIIYSYAREVEHSDNNLDAIEEYFEV